jgi:hypothetical protein
VFNRLICGQGKLVVSGSYAWQEDIWKVVINWNEGFL